MTPLQIQQYSGLPSFAICLMIAYFVLWTCFLVSAIRNAGLPEITRFMWVFIIVMVPIAGLFLYYFMAPSSSRRTLSEIAEGEAQARMSGIYYEKKKWENR